MSNRNNFQNDQSTLLKYSFIIMLIGYLGYWVCNYFYY
jgi:hypothetical protein